MEPHEKLVTEKVSQLNDRYSTEQVKDEIYRHVFRQGAGSVRIEAMIFTCMDLYAEVIKRYINQPTCKHRRVRNPKEHVENKCGLCNLPISLNL